jgi:pyruvate carboxylase
MKAIEAGVDVVDVALASMSGLTSQPNFNVLIESLKGHERYQDYNIDSLNEFSTYWETVREYYYPFESGLQAGTAEVYKHEIPGGQYSNLKPQAISLGLGERMTEIKKAYQDVNELFGDIVKVTPSSKVVGDLALYMVSNNFTKEDILSKGDQISFPESVISFFKGDLGQPYGGFPKELQKLILKDIVPYTDLPNAHIKPIHMEEETAKFKLKYPHADPVLDFLSWSFYPKVFDEYYQHHEQYGDLSTLPSLTFFYGMKYNEEILVNIGQGKTIMIRLLYISDIDENGHRTVFFRLNGQTRSIDVKDKNATILKISNTKATSEKHIGTPLQGLLSKIFVLENQEVKKGTPLFTIEAMKMETTITAIKDLTIQKIVLKEGTLVEAEDLIVETD